MSFRFWGTHIEERGGNAITSAQVFEGILFLFLKQNIKGEGDGTYIKETGGDAISLAVMVRVFLSSLKHEHHTYMQH